MAQELINNAVWGQLQRSHKMLKDAISGFDDTTWRQQTGIRPASVALHAVETVEFYFSGKTPQDFPWRHRFGVDWESAADEDLPDQPALLEYLSDVEEALPGWFEKHDLSSADNVHPYTGGTLLARCLYVIRHTQHHIGQLNTVLMMHQHPPAAWR